MGRAAVFTEVEVRLGEDVVVARGLGGAPASAPEGFLLEATRGRLHLHLVVIVVSELGRGGVVRRDGHLIRQPVQLLRRPTRAVQQPAVLQVAHSLTQLRVVHLASGHFRRGVCRRAHASGVAIAVVARTHLSDGATTTWASGARNEFERRRVKPRNFTDQQFQRLAHQDYDFIGD